MGTLISFWLARPCHFFIFNRAARDSIRPLRHKKNGPSGDQPLRPLGPRGQESTADPQLGGKREVPSVIRPPFRLRKRFRRERRRRPPSALRPPCADGRSCRLP